MSTKVTLVKTLAILAITLPVWAQDGAPDLSLGDPAPDLDITIVKGEPVDIHAQSGENVFLVEFWATWCPACRASMPHLSELQKKYKDDGLVVVGISIEELEVVKTYVSEYPSKMEYTVAADRDLSTARRYMVAFGEDSVPHAFIVDESGALVWHGHPADPSLEQVLVGLFGNAVDASAEARPGHNR